MTKEICIVGSGICGMCTAISLAPSGHTITLLERDAPPPDGDADQAFFEWIRLGAVQFRHPHAFLGLMCNLIRDNYPDLMQEFFNAGARPVWFSEMLTPQMKAKYKPQPDDEKLWVLLCRRATIETVLRRYVERLANVTIVNQTTVTGLMAEVVDSQVVVNGVHTRKDGAAMTKRADLIIDASGRGSKFPRWFADLGVPIREEKEDAQIVYYTKHFKLKPGQAEPPRGERPAAGDLGYLKFGVFPGDNGHFSVILCLPSDEEDLKAAVRDTDKFDQICSQIPGVAQWTNPDRAEATTRPFGIADIAAVWRHYVEDGKPKTVNFFAVGDASMRTNPLYGRGCSTGVMHAQILAQIVDSDMAANDQALAFDVQTLDQLRPIYDASLREDKNGIRRWTQMKEAGQDAAPDNFKKRFGAAFGDAISAASRRHLFVVRGIMKTFHLIEKPGDFLKDWRIRTIVLLYMLRGRKRNAASRLQPGPKRDELYTQLGLLEPSQ
ncbi:MAG: FAD-dependent oxidoreductase [Proteobacteria bacterium]|nr:FAD-dependent oxidoreductase [Pseudomonadota bacterium]